MKDLIRATGLAAAVAVSTTAFPVAARERREVTIGGTLPLSGPEAASGAAFREGYELAVEEANERGGLDIAGGRLPVRLRVLDDKGDKAMATAGAEELITSNAVDFLLGTFSSANVEAQSTIAEKHGVPYVAGSGAAAGLFQRKQRFLFGLQSPVKMLAATELDWIAAQQKAGLLPVPARIAILSEDTVHGVDFRAGVHRFVERNPSAWKLALDESFALNTKDFAPLIARLKAAAADVYLADAHLPDYIALHRQYLAAGLCHPVVSYGARGSEKEAAAALGADNVAYILSAVWWDPQLGGSGPSRTFVERFRAKHGRPPQWHHALAYEAVRALLAGVESAGSVDREKVRAALAALHMPTLLPSGNLNFPAEWGQQAHYPFAVLQNQPGGRAPIVFPDYVATARGLINPRCATVKTAAGR